MEVPKPLHALTTADLDRHPVWRHLDPADPAQLVTPHAKRGVAPLLSLVRCTFTANDGSVFKGFGLIMKLALVAPVIVTPDGQVPFHHGDGLPSAESLAKAYRTLRSTPERFFPVRFQVDVPVRNQPVWNTFEAFTYRAENGQVGLVGVAPGSA